MLYIYTFNLTQSNLSVTDKDSFFHQGDKVSEHGFCPDQKYNTKCGQSPHVCNAPRQVHKSMQWYATNSEADLKRERETSDQFISSILYIKGYGWRVL